MASWRIVCVKRGTANQPPHTHITGVGTGDRADWADMRWTLEKVVKAMAENVLTAFQSPSGREISE